MDVECVCLYLGFPSSELEWYNNFSPPFSCLSCSREARAHKAVKSGHYCRRNVQLWGVCAISIIVCTSCVCARFLISYEHLRHTFSVDLHLSHLHLSMCVRLVPVWRWTDIRCQELSGSKMTSPYLRSRTAKRVRVLWLFIRISATKIWSNIICKAEDNLYVVFLASSIPPLCQRPTWFPLLWRRPLVSTLSRVACTCNPPRQTRTLCSSAPWSTVCQETRSNRRSPTPSPSTSTVSEGEGARVDISELYRCWLVDFVSCGQAYLQYVN